MNIFRKIKYFIQRGKRGYSNYDLVSLDNYLQNLIVNSVLDLERNLHGSKELPYEEVDTFNSDWLLKEYSDILETMKKDKWFEDCDDFSEYTLDDQYIRCRLIYRRIAYYLNESNDEKCINQDNPYWDLYYHIVYETDEHLKWKAEDIKKLYNNYLKRDEEIKEYMEGMKNEGFKLLSKYFFTLWG